jgi:hypothetical protein
MIRLSNAPRFLCPLLAVAAMALLGTRAEAQIATNITGVYNTGLTSGGGSLASGGTTGRQLVGQLRLNERGRIEKHDLYGQRLRDHACGRVRLRLHVQHEQRAVDCRSRRLHRSDGRHDEHRGQLSARQWHLERRGRLHLHPGLHDHRKRLEPERRFQARSRSR